MTTKPAVYTIPPDVAFVDALAAHLLAQHREAPLDLPRVRVLVPTRRSCRALTMAFHRLQGDRPTLLPSISPLGDIDEDELSLDYADILGADCAFDVPPAIRPIRRQLLLARLVLALRGEITLPDQAARLARELARLIDQVHTERCSWDNLDLLVPDEFADHWQITLRFLRLVTQHWPAVLDEEGCIDPADRRNRLLAAQTAAWTARPPQTPIVVAGSTGSVPAVADLIRVVATLPFGTVVLPGLDTAADDAAWDAISQEPWHPQHGMGRLLDHIGLRPSEVRPWPVPPELASARRRGRSALVNQALHPATLAIARQAAEIPAAAVTGIAQIDLPGPEEEARAIALLMRQALEDPQQTAALITPDRPLARRVAAELRRWDIALDDSAGRPLGDTPVGAYFRLIARMVAERFAPVPLLAVLKHPLAQAGLPPGQYRHQVRALELAVLRGPRPAPDVDGLRRAAGVSGSAVAIDVVDRLGRAVAPFAALFEADTCPLSELLAAHVAAAEALAAGETEDGAAALWLEDDGEALAEFLDVMLEAADGIEIAKPASYPAFLDTLLVGQVVRPAWGQHPRLAVWGPIEARLQHADVVILGSLNENSWPPHVHASPWMSRPMLRAFGLPAPERRIGLSAHDFCQSIAAETVWLTRSRRVEGTPTVPSRWLTRLHTWMESLDPPLTFDSGAQWQAWQSLLDVADPAERGRIGPPSPCPPVAARPRRLSVTRIETWMRDPYAIYAEFVLGLRALEPVDVDPTTADYGAFIHKALEILIRRHPEQLPHGAYEQLLQCGREALAPLVDRVGVRAFWWPQFQRIAQWIIDVEREREGSVRRSLSEVSGSLSFLAPGGRFAVTATADRIDVLNDGGVTIIDYKTGSIPSEREIAEGFAPQMPLEAAIAIRGGFAELPPAPVRSIEFWQLRGRREGGRRRVFDQPVDALAEAAIQGVARLVAAFDDPDTPYQARPRASASPRYSAYEHLARVKEWATAEEGGDA